MGADGRPTIGFARGLAIELGSVLGASPETNCHLFDSMPRTLVVIPARMQSTRLPGKPLADINGTPMITHVWRRAIAADVGRVVVASDSEEINAVIRAAGGEAVLTRADHA